jgi:hypothetical protein
MPSEDDPDAGLRRISMQEMGERIVRRRAELGLVDDAELCRKLRNAGKNRTASKRALLKAIADAGGNW